MNLLFVAIVMCVISLIGLDLYTKEKEQTCFYCTAEGQCLNCQMKEEIE